MNKESTMSYTDRLKDAFQRNESKKNAQNSLDLEQLKHKTRSQKKDSKIEIYDKQKGIQAPPVAGVRVERKVMKPDNGAQMVRHPGPDPGYTPKFEVHDSYTLVAKHSPSASSMRPSSSTMTKSRSEQILQSQQPMITLKPHYGQTTTNNLIAEVTPKIIRTSMNNPEQHRSMSAVYKSQSRPDPGIHKTLSHRQQIIYQSAFRSQARPPSAISKQHSSGGNGQGYPGYESLNRPKSKGPTKISDDNNVYYSLPRKPKSSSHNGVKYGSTKRISSKLLYIDTGSTRRTKTSPIKVPNNTSVAGTTSTDTTDENLINFSQTLARAATNSPPIKRRSSSLLHAPNPRVNARFATKSMIDEIYTQKNRKDNYEKYKKAANEILKENLALRFGENYPFQNQLRDTSLHSSSSSLSSTTSSATDQQHSISSIPPDDIPLNIPNQNKNHSESFQANELFYPQKSPADVGLKPEPEVEDLPSEIQEGTVTSDEKRIEVVDNIHVSDEESNEEDSEEYDLDNEQSSSESYASDSDGDIEQFKKKFVPLHEIERMGADFGSENEPVELPDHHHSASFRIEHTSIGPIVEVFVHKESLQKAKDALLRTPDQGILSIKSSDVSNRKKRRAIFDPHILLLDACLEPDFELVKELIPKIPNISRSTVDGITALHNAVCSAEARLVSHLIQCGANVNASDADGWTPLHCAACCNNKQISKLLVENGASLFAVTLSDYEIPSQKCNKTNQEDTQCEEYLFWEQENLGMSNGGIVYALFQYVPQRPDELALTPNQILKVLDTNPHGETGWFLAEYKSDAAGQQKKGFVAAAYVSCYKLTLAK